MTSFPQVPLDFRAELSLSGWTDITSYVYQRNGAVQITRGRPDESPSPTPAQANVEVNNRDGRFSPKNPLGAYYGLIGRNTPLRISLPAQGNYLRLEGDSTSYATCPDTASLHITGDIDIRIDMLLTNWTLSTLAAKWPRTAGQQCWLLQLNPDGTLQLFWSTDGSNFPTATAAAPLPFTSGRFSVRATLAVATGTVTFYTGPAGGADGSTWTQLGSPVVTGATSIFAGTADVTAGNRLNGTAGLLGNVYEFEVRQGIAGTVRAHPVFSAQAAGTASFSDAQSNTWSMTGTAEISSRSYRFHGEVPAWPPQWDPTGTDVYAQVQAAGPLRRLGQGSKPFDSALKRAYVRLAGSQVPVAYWPCEDASAATQIASGIGGPAMLVTGAAQFAADSDFLCSLPIPTVGSSAWKGSVPAYVNQATPANMVQFLLDIPAGGTVNGAVIARVLTTGTIARLDVTYSTGGALILTGFDSGGTQLFTTGAVTFNINGVPCRISVALVKNGTGADYHIDEQTVGGGQLGGSGTQASATVGLVRQVIINPNGAALSGVGVGHISVQAFYSVVANLASQLSAWAGEAAGNRYGRLCGEEGLQARIIGAPSASAAMGPQTPQTLLQLLQECEDADRGQQFEPRTCLGLGYRTQASLCNQAAAVTLDYPSAHLAPPLSPVDDDQFVKNDVTVTRSGGGSSSRQLLTTGALSNQPPPNGVGTYDTAVTINLQADGQLDSEASWIVHVLTTDDLRYPAVTVNMARSEIYGNTSLFFAVQEADVGAYVAVTNPPSWLPPGPVRQLAAGVTEKLGGFVYEIAFQCVPESAYEVAVSDDLVYGRADTDGATVHANITSAATSMQVDTTTAGSPLWTTSAGDFPFDIAAGGERMTVTNITGASSPQTFTVTRHVNGIVKAQAAGTDVRLWYPPVAALN